MASRALQVLLPYSQVRRLWEKLYNMIFKMDLGM
jgi:hypothetical protein